ncbi:MAG: tetratricopeptide repeat protein [Gammaproteobacteria bacterium]
MFFSRYLTWTLVLTLSSLLVGCGSAPQRGGAPVEAREVGRGTVPTDRAPTSAARKSPATSAASKKRFAEPASDAPVSKPLSRYRPPAPAPVLPGGFESQDDSPIAPSGSVAVVKLMDSAAASADPSRAAAVLERALRIEPDNPVIWHRLAQSRLQQGRFAQAEAVALKSNALAGGRVGLKRANWAIVAEARTALGDHSGASEAERKRQSGGR